MTLFDCFLYFMGQGGWTLLGMGTGAIGIVIYLVVTK